LLTLTLPQVIASVIIGIVNVPNAIILIALQIAVRIAQIVLIAEETAEETAAMVMEADLKFKIKMVKKQKIILAVCLALLVFVIGAFVYIFNNNSNLRRIFMSQKEKARIEQQINDKYKSGWQDMAKGNPREGVLIYKKSMKESRDVGISIDPKRSIELATAQIKSGQTKEGIRLLKEVSLGKNNLRKDRAYAINKLAELSLVIPGSILEEVLFSDPQMAGFYVPDYPLRTKANLLSWANSFYGTTPNFFQLAYYSADRYIDSFREDSPLKEKREDYKKQIIDMLNKGEVIFSRLGSEKLGPDRLLICYLFRAKTYSLIEKINDPELNAIKKSEEEIENSFQKAIELSLNPYNKQGPEDWIQFSYLYYAEHMVQNGGGDRDKINEALNGIVRNQNDSTNQGFIAFLRKEVRYSMLVSHRQEIIKLTGINPSWDNYLKSAGWNLDQVKE
jgi:hypothetical protein